MKKLSLVLALAILLAVAMPFTASAGPLSNFGKNVVRTVACPLKAAGAVVVDIGQTVTFQKPTAILAIPKHVRQQATDMVESAGRALVCAEPIGIDDNGSVTNAVSDNGLDPWVDLIVYGVVPAVWTHNAMEIGAGSHHLLPWKILGLAGGGVVAADLIDNAVEK